MLLRRPFFAHSVGETNEDLQALIAAAEEFGGPGFLVPARNGELYRFCLARRLRVVGVDRSVPRRGP